MCGTPRQTRCHDQGNILLGSMRTILVLTAIVAGANALHSAAVGGRSPSPLALRSRLRGPPTLALPEPRILTEENAQAVLEECMNELGTLFGTNADSRRVGITGAVSFVELDVRQLSHPLRSGISRDPFACVRCSQGPTLIVQLSGRFWHQRTQVVERVERYVLDRIPECVAVEVEDVAQLDDADPDECAARYGPLHVATCSLVPSL